MSGRVAIVVLAAGASRRLGRPKQLEPYGGTTLLGHAAQVALEAALGPVVIVLGAEAERCRTALAQARLPGTPVVIVNPAWASGIASSIGAGVGEAARLDPPCDAVLLTTCDQPLVDAAHLRSLVQALLGSGTSIAATRYAGTSGVPAVFGRSHWPELTSLTGDCGAKSVLKAHEAHVTAVPCEAAAHDRDTDADARGE